MEQQAFAAVQEAEADDVVVGERRQRVEDDVPDEAEGVAAGLAAGDGETRHLVAVAVHVLEVELQGGISVVEQIALHAACGTVVEGCAVRAVFVGHPRGSATEEAQLAVGIESAVTHPAAKDLVAAIDPVGVVSGVAGE